MGQGRRRFVPTRRLLLPPLLLLLILVVLYFARGENLTGQLRGAYRAALSWDASLLNWRLAWAALVPLTLFLAFTNLYLKITMQAPKLNLRPSTFINIPFTLYVTSYLFLSALGLLVLEDLARQNWFAGAIAASALGISVGNADVQFGGFKLLPLYEFLQGLEEMSKARLSIRAQELDVARRSRLRDRLAIRVPKDDLLRECKLQNVEEERLAEIEEKAGEDDRLHRSLLAREIIANSEPNAERMVHSEHVLRWPWPQGGERGSQKR